MHFWRGIPGTEVGCIQTWKGGWRGRFLGFGGLGLATANVCFSARAQLVVPTLGGSSERPLLVA